MTLVSATQSFSWPARLWCLFTYGERTHKGDVFGHPPPRNDGRSVASTVCATKRHRTPHDLAFFASHLQDRVHLLKKYHSESGLYHRDEDPRGFFVTQVPMSPRENSLSGGVVEEGRRAGTSVKRRLAQPSRSKARSAPCSLRCARAGFRASFKPTTQARDARARRGWDGTE